MNETSQTSGAATPRPWALLAYLCGDNATLAAHVKAQADAIRTFTGSPHLHVAVQYDLPVVGATRIAQREDGTWDEEPLERVNSGDNDTWHSFFRWAFDRCPSERVIVVVSGTGLLDPRAAYGNPDVDRGHLFTVCEDETDNDALHLSEFGSVLREALHSSDRDAIDVLALDMRELQCLEVAYEIDRSARVLVAPQTRVPDQGWDFAVVLKACADALAASRGNLGEADMSRVVLHAAADGYEPRRAGTVSISALDLGVLDDVAAAFDTLSLALLHSVGEELVWRARAAVANRLKPPAPAVLPGGPPADNESEYLYDLPELLTELKRECAASARAGLVTLVTEYLGGLDLKGLQHAIVSLDAACFGPAARLRHRALRDIVATPAATRAHLRDALGRVSENWPAALGAAVREAFTAVFTDPASVKGDRQSWLEDWPPDVMAEVDPELSSVFVVARQQQARLLHLTALIQRVLVVLGSEVTAAAPTRRLVLDHVTRTADGSPGRHGGVSLFRPRDLDHLVASDYLDMRFNRSIHWTVLLAVINMIGNHPRALWRILSALLATADNTTRAQLLERITGPSSVVGSYRQQFVVLAPAKALVLTLEPDPQAQRTTAATRAPGAAVPADAYRVRLEQADREASISEVISRVDPTKIARLVKGLDQLLQSSAPMQLTDAQEVEALGRTLGEDILQSLGRTLAEQAERGPVHLQLQIPGELMKYPWELMHHQGGWLLDDFAIGRQVFSRAGTRVVTARRPGALRALVIGNPKSSEVSLEFAAEEAKVVGERLATLASETDGLIDFVPGRDLLVDQPLTGTRLRQLLRQGQYDLIHFAGHARFDADDPDASAWLLTDGPLTAREIRNTLAWAETHPWLVFANACESGMAGVGPYQGEGFGLASAFLDHGVSAFIGPLWPIADNVAAQTAKLFYTHLLKERRTVGEALHKARVAMKRQHFEIVDESDGVVAAPTRAAVGSWAGLVLYGNATATLGQRLGAPPPPSRPYEREDAAIE